MWSSGHGWDGLQLQLLTSVLLCSGSSRLFSTHAWYVFWNVFRMLSSPTHDYCFYFCYSKLIITLYLNGLLLKLWTLSNICLILACTICLIPKKKPNLKQVSRSKEKIIIFCHSSPRRLKGIIVVYCIYGILKKRQNKQQQQQNIFNSFYIRVTTKQKQNKTKQKWKHNKAKNKQTNTLQ